LLLLLTVLTMLAQTASLLMVLTMLAQTA